MTNPAEIETAKPTINIEMLEHEVCVVCAFARETSRVVKTMQKSVDERLVDFHNTQAEEFFAGHDPSASKYSRDARYAVDATIAILKMMERTAANARITARTTKQKWLDARASIR